MSNSLVIRAVFALMEAGFTKDEVYEVLPLAPTPAGPTTVWDGNDYWDRNPDDGLWTCSVHWGDAPFEQESYYARWTWPRLFDRYNNDGGLWTGKSKTIRVPRDAWPL